MDGICVKRCHWDAGSARLFNDRPICSCSFRRKICGYFLNGIYGLSDTLARVIVVSFSLKTAIATTAFGMLLVRKNSPFRRVPWLIFIYRCFSYLGSFISCLCEGFKRTRTIYHPNERSRAVYQRMSIVSIGLRALIWARI